MSSQLDGRMETEHKCARRLVKELVHCFNDLLSFRSGFSHRISDTVSL